MKREMKRWRKFFWVRTCIKPNLVLSEISEMKRWRVRWRDEQMKKKIFWSEHVSSQIWCYLKLVRWRVRWRDEENVFWVRTCIKPNLVLSEISEMKSEMNRWRKFFLVWTCIKPNLVLSEISEMKRWRVRWRKFFLVQTCIKPNLVLSEISEMKRWRVRWRDEKKFFGVRTCIKPNLVSKIFPFIGGGGGGSEKLHPSIQTDIHTYIHTDTIVTR